MIRRIVGRALKPLWNFYGDKKDRLKEILVHKEIFVVSGFRRSGTSLVSGMVHGSGVFFGEAHEMKKSDFRNPLGFFEHRRIFELSVKFLHEAGFKNDLAEHNDFRANNFLHKIFRYITRVQMVGTLEKISKRKNKIGFKNFPIFFYFWRSYLPKYKLIAVYREPHTVAVSMLHAWDQAYRFDEAIRKWTVANKDLLHHVLTSEHAIIVKYEDLFDDARKHNVLKSLANFIGATDVPALQSLIKSDLNRSNVEASKLKKFYPLPEETLSVLNILDSIRI